MWWRTRGLGPEPQLSHLGEGQSPLGPVEPEGLYSSQASRLDVSKQPTLALHARHERTQRQVQAPPIPHAFLHGLPVLTGSWGPAACLLSGGGGRGAGAHADHSTPSSHGYQETTTAASSPSGPHTGMSFHQQHLGPDSASGPCRTPPKHVYRQQLRSELKSMAGWAGVRSLL